MYLSNYLTVPRPTNIMEKPSKKSSPLAGRVPKESKGPHQLEFSGTASVRKKQQGTPKAKDVTVSFHLSSYKI